MTKEKTTQNDFQIKLLNLKANSTLYKQGSIGTDMYILNFGVFDV